MKHLARKRFGQNFLVDAGVVGRILGALALRPGDLVIEIGPGLGALTEPLLAAIGLDRLHVIELDRDLAARLRQRAHTERLVIHEADVLSFDFARLIPPGQRVRVLGNLPYNISTPLLFHLQQFAEDIVDQHFMLQREVVQRMVAAPGSAAYGRLSVMLQVSYAMEALFDVAPESFEPAPKVTSSLIRMVPLERGAFVIRDQRCFALLVRQAFSQRRKMLRNTLGEFDALVPMREFGLEPSARAESISPALYVDYANALWERQRNAAQ
jgi:16S rRNA (adenine1518-N6/adenine1519-N6)-dimethyltransferase